MAKGQKTGGGSRKGVPNRVTGDVKAMILMALDKAGGDEYLLRQAASNPSAFLQLVGKVLPMQVTVSGGGAMIIKVITGVPRASDDDEPSDDGE